MNKKNLMIIFTYDSVHNRLKNIVVAMNRKACDE